MKTFVFLMLLTGVALAGEEQQSKYDYWGQKLTLNDWAVKCNEDTLKLFLSAPDCLPADDITGLPIMGTMTKKITPDGLRGWIWIVEGTADVKRPGNKQYWAYAIRPVLIFDLDKGQKK